MTAYPAPAAPVPAPPENRPAPRPPTLVDAIPRSRNRRKISAIVTTYNEAGTISGCLDSLAWCDEILVVDSFSTDETREIAGRRERVRVLQRPYYGAASQKNWAIDRCRFDWVLILDADERVTPELRREIEAKLAGPAAATAFTIKRRTFALGDEIRFSGWQHDRVVRLFRRGAARYPNRRVHADMETAETPRLSTTTWWRVSTSMRNAPAAMRCGGRPSCGEKDAAESGCGTSWCGPRGVSSEPMFSSAVF
jgi:hypothetical protein